MGENIVLHYFDISYRLYVHNVFFHSVKTFKFFNFYIDALLNLYFFLVKTCQLRSERVYLCSQNDDTLTPSPFNLPSAKLSSFFHLPVEKVHQDPGLQ